MAHAFSRTKAPEAEVVVLRVQGEPGLQTESRTAKLCYTKNLCLEKPPAPPPPNVVHPLRVHVFTLDIFFL